MVEDVMICTAGPGCLPDWHYLSTRCVFIGETEGGHTWKEAEQLCRRKEARSHLVSVHYQHEALEIHNLLDREVNMEEEGGVGEAVWLGGRREAGMDEDWMWSDGSSLDWSGWLEGQPSKGEERAAMCIKSRRVVGVTGGDPYWYDIQCNNRFDLLVLVF